MTTALVKASAHHEALMARQLSEQYQRAVGGLWEVTKFGAMMLHLQGNLNSARGIQKGQIRYEGSLKEWIEKHCPEISTSSAWRFMALAEGLKHEFKLGVKVDLQALLMSDADDLPAKMKKIRAAIAQFIEGKSQRQLLLSFGHDHAKKGGDNELQKWLREHHPDHVGARLRDLPKDVKAAWSAYVAAKLKDPALLRELARADWDGIAEKLREEGIDKTTWTHLSPRTLENIHGLLIDVAKLIGAAIK